MAVEEQLPRGGASGEDFQKSLRKTPLKKKPAQDSPCARFLSKKACARFLSKQSLREIPLCPGHDVKLPRPGGPLSARHRSPLGVAGRIFKGVSRWLNLWSFLSLSFSLYRPLGPFLGLWCLLVLRFYGTTRTWSGKEGTTSCGGASSGGDTRRRQSQGSEMFSGCSNIPRWKCLERIHGSSLARAVGDLIWTLDFYTVAAGTFHAGRK